MIRRKHLHRFTMRQVTTALNITNRTLMNWRHGTGTREPLPVIHTRPRGLSGRSPVFIYEWRLLQYLETYRPDLRRKWDANLHLMRAKPNPLPPPRTFAAKAEEVAERPSMTAKVMSRGEKGMAWNKKAVARRARERADG